MKKPTGKQWPWQAAGVDSHRRPSVFQKWLREEIEKLERRRDIEADPEGDFIRDFDPAYKVFIQQEHRRWVNKPRVLAAVEALKKDKKTNRDKKLTNLVTLTDDPELRRIAFAESFRLRGGKTGTLPKKGQRQYSDEERELLREIAADVRLIRFILKANGLRGDDILVSPEEIVVERVVANEQWWKDKKSRNARKINLERDLRNYMKNN